ncbi:MAG: hypothetical protein F6K62_01700 [Sphaerospermopsis sp. SIO1G2]|nr:hypothetical protein [Sphaerospermopsis sp. SIO1G2]
MFLIFPTRIEPATATTTTTTIKESRQTSTEITTTVSHGGSITPATLIKPTSAIELPSEKTTNQLRQTPTIITTGGSIIP